MSLSSYIVATLQAGFHWQDLKLDNKDNHRYIITHGAGMEVRHGKAYSFVSLKTTRRCKHLAQSWC